MDGGLSQLLLGNGKGAFTPVSPEKSGLIVSKDAKSLVATDFNRDGRMDFIVASNNNYLQAFQNQIEGTYASLFDLAGLGQDKLIPGSRVEVEFESGRVSVREVYAGSGYLSQSSQRLYFGRPNGDAPANIKIRWSDGSVTEHEP